MSVVSKLFTKEAKKLEKEEKIMTDKEKLDLLNELQELQGNLLIVKKDKNMYQYNEFYSELNNLIILLNQGRDSGHYRSTIETDFNHFLEGRTMYSSSKLEAMSKSFHKLSEIRYLQENIEENIRRWETRIVEIKKELGIN